MTFIDSRDRPNREGRLKRKVRSPVFDFRKSPRTIKAILAFSPRITSWVKLIDGPLDFAVRARSPLVRRIKKTGSRENQVDKVSGAHRELWLARELGDSMYIGSWTLEKTKVAQNVALVFLGI
jgi:hypothetical protein